MSNVFNKQGNVSTYVSAMCLNYKGGSREMIYPISIEVDACHLRRLPDDDMTLYVEGTVLAKKD